MSCIRILSTAASLLLLALTAAAQYGQYPPILDEHCYRDPWIIQNRIVEATIKHQVVTVSVTDEIYNPQAVPIETEYVFPLPPRAAVDGFTLLMNGQELCGTIMDAGQARSIYDQIVRARRDPGLLEYAGCGLFRSSAFPLGPHQSASLTIQYTMTCEMDGDRVEFWYPMNTGPGTREPIRNVEIRCDIESDVPISTVYSPTAELQIERRNSRRVSAKYVARDYRPVAAFQLFYVSSREEIGASLFSYWPEDNEDGYYMLLLNPSPELAETQTLPKDLMIVLDRSGSMSGEKIKQACDAARYVIDRLNPHDRFNILAYSDHVDECFERLVSVTAEAKQEAHDYVDRIAAVGGTNIHDALERAMELCSSSEKYSLRPAYIIFLTDGLPTVGTTGEENILNNTRQTNRSHIRLFSFGVGYDVNVRLLDKLAEQNSGRTAYVNPAESIESKISSLYNRVRNPVMTDCTVEIAGYRTRHNCPDQIGDIFQGDQLVRAGRIYRSSIVPAGFSGGGERCVLSLSGNVRGTRQTYNYAVNPPARNSSSANKFVEKVWAVRRVGALLDEIQLHGRVEESVDELIQLSKKYGIVTPYTSFLADEQKMLSEAPQMRYEAVQDLSARSLEISGKSVTSWAGSRKKLSAVESLPSSHSAYMLHEPSNISTAGALDSEDPAGMEESSIRIVGNSTLYKRGELWIAENATHLDLTRDAALITRITKFSDDYFKLTNSANEDERTLLAGADATSKLLIIIQGRAYLIE